MSAPAGPGEGGGEPGGFASFAALARHRTIVPVWREVAADTVTPVAAFLGAVGEGPGFLLESVESNERWGRFSFVGRAPLATVVARQGRVEVEGAVDLPVPAGPGILATLESLLAHYQAEPVAGLPPLHSGMVGYLAYDVVREIEHLPAVPPDDCGLPDAVISVIGQLAVFDHWRQALVLVDNVVVPRGASRDDLAGLYEAAEGRLARLATDCTRREGTESPVPLPVPPVTPASAQRTVAGEEYRRAVEVAKEHVRQGDVFQVVLSQRFDLDLDVAPFEVYRALRLLNPSPYLYFLRHPDVTVVGSSPEPMVRVRDGVVTSRPIAGSRPRGAGATEDARLAGELSEDPKEVAEHVMLVDLARNDLGRVCTFGSETVDELMTVERYSHVMHLTSQVSGRLRAGVGAVDVLRATLPAGTLSGAPKVRAMEIIDDLERTKRGVYGGVVGYLDFSGNLDTAIAIRTMVVRPGGHASVQAGAGIVADSDPTAEDAECSHKAAALLAATTAARQMARMRTVPTGSTAETGSRPAPVAGGPTGVR